MSSKPLPNPKWVDYSSGLIGYNENTHRQLIMSWARDIGPDYWSMNFDPSQDQSDWQTLFVAHCLKRCGGSLPKNHLIAQEWLAYGDLLKQPYLGSLIIVMSQDVFHIGFAVGITPDGQLVMRGSNQDDGIVNMAVNPKSVFQHRWPRVPGSTPGKLPTMRPVRPLIIG